MTDATSSEDWQSLLKVMMLKVDICILQYTYLNNNTGILIGH